MKRSEINQHIKDAIALFDVFSFKLPKFAYFSPETWQATGHEANEIRDNGLGWDVTDFGLGDFDKIGLLLFTIRNGNYKKRNQYPKMYAEKIMVIQEGQTAPMHFHWSKREDIINRGGGNLILELYMAGDDGELSDKSLSVSIDGIKHPCKSGQIITLVPGESVCLEPYIYHKFYAEQGKGTVIIGQVSDVNDDDNDNRFLETLGRYPEIIEDEPPLYLLCNEYL